MVLPVVVVEVMYQFEVLITIQTCIVMHLIDLEFPDFIFIGGWSGGTTQLVWPVATPLVIRIHCYTGGVATVRIYPYTAVYT